MERGVVIANLTSELAASSSCQAAAVRVSQLSVVI